MDKRYTTRQVAQLLDIKPTRILRAIWDGRLREPTEKPGRAYLWSLNDIEAASQLFRGRDTSDIFHDLPGSVKQEIAETARFLAVGATND